MWRPPLPGAPHSPTPRTQLAPGLSPGHLPRRQDILMYPWRPHARSDHRKGPPWWEWLVEGRLGKVPVWSRDRDWTRSHWLAVGSQHASPLVWVLPGWREGVGASPRPPLCTAISVCCSPSPSFSLFSRRQPITRGSPENPRAMPPPAGLSMLALWPAPPRPPWSGSLWLDPCLCDCWPGQLSWLVPKTGFQILAGKALCWDQGLSPLSQPFIKMLLCLSCTEPLPGCSLWGAGICCQVRLLVMPVGWEGLLAWPVTGPGSPGGGHCFQRWLPGPPSVFSQSKPS